MSEQPDRPPFDKHRHYYLVLKVVVLLAALYLAVRYLTPLAGI
jgi:hypothetical protein